MIGETIGHYRIAAKIGEGGMGVVYRAHAQILQRDVALKLVSEGAAAGKPSRQHLLQEARAASALSHPNICTIHEVGEFGDELYMIMELVEGKSLRELRNTCSIRTGVFSTLAVGASPLRISR